MKHIFTTLYILALFIAESTAVTADADSDASYSPIFVKEYNHGDFDELGINKTHQLSPSR